MVVITLHAGVHDTADLATNPRSGKLQYAGQALALANTTCSVGQGGMVLLQDSTFKKVRSQVAGNRTHIQHALHMYCIFAM